MPAPLGSASLPRPLLRASQNDFRRDQWPWRDWVLRAFQDNLPYDRFVLEQVAGDLVEPRSTSAVLATGFQRNHRMVTEAGSIDEFMFKEGVKDVLEKLDNDLVGLIPVKTRVRQIAALLVMDKMRRKLGFDTAVPSLHMCFTGAPGTGKTTVAVRMGQILAKMGYCRSGHVVVATRDDLVGQYVGHTAPKTKEVIKQALGGVLLVDEAYYLYNAANDRDYGQESIEILLTFMENNREDLVVVLAGYKDRMDKFFSFIPGMSSRIGNHIDFPNYEVDELFEISKVMSRDLDYEMTDEAGDVFKKYIERRMAMPFFSNARTVRNAMDRARMNAAIRVFDQAIAGANGGDVGADDLKAITADDFQVILDEALAAEDDAILA